MSLDAVYDEHERDGAARWTALASWARDAQLEKGKDERPLFLPRSPLPVGTAGYDPCKLIVDASRFGRRPADITANLLATQGVRPEMIDHRYLVFSVTRGTTREHLEGLVSALRELTAPDEEHQDSPPPASATRVWPRTVPRRAAPMRRAMQGARRVVPLHASVGMIAARQVGPYPPGIPLLLPGEVVDPATVHALVELLAAGITVRGIVSSVQGPSLTCLAEESAATE